MKTYIIAEAGVNHNGDRDTALKMIDEAKKCGCDCIKFQTFRTEDLVTRDAKKAEYQVVNTKNHDSQFQMLKKLELSFEDFKILKEHCDETGIEFMSTPFDCASVDLLEELGVTVYKMSSGDITNKPLLQYVANKRMPIILSTGMCTLEEVREAVEWIEACRNNRITLLHCTSNYPTPYHEVNMNAMMTLEREFPYPAGYSDHTEGIVIPVMAAALGAAVIEKHFTLDKNMEGPDHKASLNCDELAELVNAVRAVEAARGNGRKEPMPGEISTRTVARKSIVLKRAMPKGAVLQEQDLVMKRPGNGISPKYLEHLIGKVLVKDLAEDTLIGWEDIE